ncbi:MAG: hypothetical protein CFE21_04810 [Bacteroidetes bacterium B1(2017)]|nr:MAG: hypothetical protein CFE21_04810 [Bacteroidetes bacterium B1(2017)]
MKRKVQNFRRVNLLKATLMLIFSSIALIGFGQPGSMSNNTDCDGSYGNNSMTTAGVGSNNTVFTYREAANASTSSGTKFYQFNADGYFNTWNLNTPTYNTVSTATWAAGAGYNGNIKMGATVSGSYYTFNIRKGSSYASQSMAILETAFQPKDISSYTGPSAAYGGQDISVSVTMSGALSTGEYLYVAYSKDGFATSNNSGCVAVGALNGSFVGTATISGMSGTISYYPFTSVSSTAPAFSDIPLLTLNMRSSTGQNNTGAYSTYTFSTWTTQSGASTFSAGSSWVGGVAPVAGSNMGLVTLNHDITLNQDNTVSVLTIATGVTFTASDGSARVLTVSNTSSTTSIANSGTWVNGSSSTINFTGSGSSADVVHTVSGSYSLNNVVINKTVGSGYNVGVNFGSAVLANGGKLTIGNGGYLTSIVSGFYNTSGAICTLEFSNSGGYTINNGDATWPSSNSPSNITISSGAVVLNTARTASGNLTISGGSLTLGAALTINGDWTRASSATFTPSTNSVTLSGSSQQTITITGGGTCSMYGLVVNNSAGVILSSSPATNLSVTNSLTLTSGTINANGNTITLGSGIAITRASGTLSVVPTFSGTSSVTYNTGGTTTDNELNSTVTTLACTNGTGTITLKAGASITATGVSTTSGGTLNVPSTSTLIVGASGVANSGALTVAGTFQINAGGFVNTNSPSYSGTSTLIYNTAGAYGRSNEWPSSNGPTNVTISNSGTNLTLGAARTLTGTLTVNSGCTFNSGSNLLTLANGARIANSSGATFSGTVNIVFATTARRAFRLFGHPFSSAIAMNQLTGTGELDITGNATGASTSGSACTGCTATTNNAPSSFSYSPASGNSGTSPDPGWTSFNDLSTSSWSQYQGIRVLVRGVKGEGLTSGTGYTPSAATITVSGGINDGSNKTITLTSGVSSDYNLISNPFCSQIDFGSIAGGQRTGVGNNFYTWNPALSTRGAYVSTTFGTPYILPIMGAVFVSKGSASNITINESDKVSGSAQALFKNDPNAVDQLAITVVSDTITWDFYKLRFRNDASNTTDDQDAIKFVNPELALSSLSSEGKKLAIDVRPVPANETLVDLSFERAPQGNLKFDFSASQLPATPIYLDDKFTHTQTLVSSNLVYSFDVTGDAASYAENRFSLILNKGTTGLASLNGASEKQISLYPNPASTTINLQVNTPTNATYTYILVNQLGEELGRGDFNFNSKNTHALNIETLSNGVYFVKVVSGTSSQTIKFIK